MDVLFYLEAPQYSQSSRVSGFPCLQTEHTHSLVMQISEVFASAKKMGVEHATKASVKNNNFFINPYSLE